MIRQVRIRRFRSINDLTVECDRITTIVGPNDAGKSNVVRALNLFFNGQTDDRQGLDFEKDFNKFSTSPKKKAPQIEIEVTFKIPKSFGSKGRTEVVWQKAWRRESDAPVKNKICFPISVPLPPRSKIPTYLQRHILQYVPAIKDQSFFTNLLGKIYDYLSKSSSRFLIGDDLPKSTAELVGDLNEQLDNIFEISLPDNLRQIFENLTIKNEDGIPLSRRGDGIKIRHIPELLKFITKLADEKVGKPNAVKPSHIWVFEEPENNLEINSALGMVGRLNEIMSKLPNLQIFITTHSPVFYEMAQDVERKSESIRHFVDINENSSFIEKMDGDEIDEKMGLLNLIASTVSKYKQQLDEARERISSMGSNGIDFLTPHIFVEGENDRQVFQRVLELSFPEYIDKLNIACTENGSANSVISYLHAWQLYQQHRKSGQVKAYGLLDDDQAALDAIDKLPPTFKNRFIRHQRLHVVGPTLELSKTKYSFTKDLESLYSDAYWEKAQDQGWLEVVDDLELVNKRFPREIADAIKSRPDNGSPVDKWGTLSDTQCLRIQHKFTLKGKKRASQYLSSCGEEEAREALENLREQLEVAIKWLFNDSRQDEL